MLRTREAKRAVIRSQGVNGLNVRSVTRIGGNNKQRERPDVVQSFFMKFLNISKNVRDGPCMVLDEGLKCFDALGSAQPHLKSEHVTPRKIAPVMEMKVKVGIKMRVVHRRIQGAEDFQCFKLWLVVEARGPWETLRAVLADQI